MKKFQYFCEIFHKISFGRKKYIYFTMLTTVYCFFCSKSLWNIKKVLFLLISIFWTKHVPVTRISFGIPLIFLTLAYYGGSGLRCFGTFLIYLWCLHLEITIAWSPIAAYVMHSQYFPFRLVQAIFAALSRNTKKFYNLSSSH